MSQDGEIYALDQLSNEDGLADPDVKDELDRGYSPPERLSGAMREALADDGSGETLEHRLAQEVPEVDPYDMAASEDPNDLDDGEVGDERAGRLVDPDQGGGQDLEAAMIGDDAGIDGAAASAEEAAVHVIPEDGEQV